jgi:SAM-dependent methyltransferase
MAPTLGRMLAMSPPDVEADTRAYYRARAAEYEQWIRRQGRYAHGSDDDTDWNRELGTITQFVEALSNGSVFEVASGTGWWSRVLARSNVVFALDYAPEMLTEACQHDTPAMLIHRCRADAYHLPLATGAVDACAFGFWLSHVPVPRAPAFIREASRTVRPGGQLLVVDSRQDPKGGAADQHTGGPRVQQQLRRLNDGREYTIWKIYWTPDDLRFLLSLTCRHVEVIQTDRFFIAARGTVA